MAKTKTLNLLIRQDSMYIVQSVTNSLAPKPGEVLTNRAAQEYVNDPRWKVNVKWPGGVPGREVNVKWPGGVPGREEKS